MSLRTLPFSSLAVFLGALLSAADAKAQCCPGYSLATACSDVTLAKSRWCIQDTVPTGQSALPKAFCSYGDKVISTLETLFNIQAKGTFEFELDTKTGGAHTGTACNGLGNGTAYDAFSGSAYGATYFWGYLLSLHEAINDWTGMSSGGWPTDWWADHISAFPNTMDFHVMATIGTANTDMNLIKAAAAQKMRFYPGGDSADPRVVALDNVFLTMPNMDGFAGFSHVFAMQSSDGVSWDGLGVPNPDVKRSEYVAAYMSLAAHQSVLSLLQGPGKNGGGTICAGKADGVAGDAPYTCSEAHIDTIATAHCSIAANGKPAASLTAFRSGNYATIPSGPCGASCPSECACDASNHCVAFWLGSTEPGDGGDTGSEGGGAEGGSGASTPGGGSGGDASLGGVSSGSTASGTGGAGSTSGVGSASASGDTSSGSISVAGGDSGAVGSTSGSTSGTGNGGAPPSTSEPASGCSCRTVGEAPGSSGAAGLWAAAALSLLGIGRARARRR